MLKMFYEVCGGRRYPHTYTFTCKKCKCSKEVREIPKGDFCDTCKVKINKRK